MNDFVRGNEVVIGEARKNRTKTVKVVVADFEGRPLVHLELHEEGKEGPRVDLTLSSRATQVRWSP